MPTYDYLCQSCGHELEAFQRFSEDPLRDCPVCKKPKLQRQFGTGGAILFRGSGFYETDYRSESYRTGAKQEKTASTGGTETKTPPCGGNPKNCPACE